MKLATKNLGFFLRLLTLSVVVGTLAWELVERIVTLSGGSLELSVGPIGFDIEVVAISVMANPGSLLGCVAAVVLFARL
jgi:hypothetical protein